MNGYYRILSRPLEGIDIKEKRKQNKISKLTEKLEKLFTATFKCSNIMYNIQNILIFLYSIIFRILIFLHLNNI